MKSLEQALEATGMPGEKVDISMHVKFTKSERDVLKVLAHEEGVPVNVMIRRAVLLVAMSKQEQKQT